MKNKVYVERLADRLVTRDTNAMNELIKCFINEYNAEIRQMRITTDEAANALIEKFNRKGNELKAMLEAKTGRNVLKKDWFSNVAKVLKGSVK